SARPRKVVASKDQKAVKKQPNFTTVNEIRDALKAQDQPGLIQALTTLRNQFTVRFSESQVAPNDERLLLAQRWLESSSTAQEIFDLWDQTDSRQSSLVALVTSVLAVLLQLLSSHYTFHSLGQPILKALLTPVYLTKINACIAAAHNDSIISALRLFNAMSDFAGGRERKAVMEGFAWELKSLPKLLQMRRKTKAEEHVDSLAKPDIRTLYTLFLLSFVKQDNTAQLKTSFLEQHRDAFLAIFKGLHQDHYTVVRRVLEICWSGIWQDAKVKRTLKISLFSETTVSHLAKLYERIISDDDEPDHVVADLVHHFLLAICTHPGTGICFKDNGWYPRGYLEEEDPVKHDEDEEPRKGTGGRVYNKILGNIVKTLKVNEDPRQQELAMKILQACPELVAGYWSGASLVLEPRLASKWLINVSLLGSIISHPIPLQTFFLPNNSTLHQPIPPPLNIILENILPSVNTKSHFSKGLQSSSALVQHTTAIVLSKCLTKLRNVFDAFNEAEEALGETEVDGQWSKRRRDLEREARRRVPDFQVILAFSQHKPTVTTKAPANPVKVALLAEAAQRLLWLYHQTLPALVEESRFDAGKSLLRFTEAYSTSEIREQENGGDAAAKLDVIQQLHSLRLLKESDQFSWSNKPTGSSHSYLHILLIAFTSTKIPSIRHSLLQLLNHLLKSTILFQEDPDETTLWFKSLPHTKRSTDAEAPDGAKLTDEAESVVGFLDECVQRCLKTPYKYIEELYALQSSFSSTSEDQDQDVSSPHLDAYPSPLIMTLLEQLNAKITAKLLLPSDILALASYLRKLVYQLTTKQSDLAFLRMFVERLDEVLAGERLGEEFPVVSAAIRREVGLMKFSLDSIEVRTGGGDVDMEEVGVVPEVNEFISNVERSPIPNSSSLKEMAAYELVDWFRVVDQPLAVGQVKRIVAVIEKLYAPALRDVAENLDPRVYGLLWDGLGIASADTTNKREDIDFEVLFLHIQPGHLEDNQYCERLVQALFTSAPSLIDLKRALNLVYHQINTSTEDKLTRGLLQLATSILRHASKVLSATDWQALKEHVFVRPGPVKDLFFSNCTSAIVTEGLRYLAQASLNPKDDGDRQTASDIAQHWLVQVRDHQDTQPFPPVLVSTIWPHYLNSSDLFGLFDLLTSSTHDLDSQHIIALLESVLDGIKLSISLEPASESLLSTKLSQLLSLGTLLPQSAVLEQVTALAVDVSLPLGCKGTLTETESSGTLDSVIKRAETRFARRQSDDQVSSLPLDMARQALEQPFWSKSTITVLTGLIYRRSLPEDVFLGWLNTESCAGRSVDEFVEVFHAFLDVESQTEGLEEAVLKACVLHTPRLLETLTSQGSSSSDLVRTRCVECLGLLAGADEGVAKKVFSKTLGYVKKLPVDWLCLEIVELVNLCYVAKSKSKSKLGLEALCVAVVEHGFQWGVRVLSNEGDEGSMRPIFEGLERLLSHKLELKAHLVENFLGVAVSHMNHISALRVVNAALKLANLKPVAVNRYLQAVVQHQQFFKLCNTPIGTGPQPRDAIVNLLHTLFFLHPSNTCQISHVQPLVQVYRGTLSTSDRKLLSIFQLFELERKLSAVSLLSRWSGSTNGLSSNSLEALQSLDPILVLRTCLHFPRRRRILEAPPEEREQVDFHEAQLYDPVFLILLFAHMLVDNPAQSHFAWVELFRTNVVALIIRTLSADDPQLREVALCQLAALWKNLEVSDVQEQPQIHYVLTILKDTLLMSPNEPSKRLPSYSTLILLHVLRGIFYPSNFTYPLTSRFLLQRPELDTSDVPMLYGMLYSNSDDWKKERGWIIRFLSDGMVNSDDWKVFKRRHTWDLLASMFQSSEGDQALRSGVFEVLANLTCNQHATTSLVLKSALLSWIEIQILRLQPNETLEWLKIIENIVVIVDATKIETATAGEWRAIICRCIASLLTDIIEAHIPRILPLAASLLLRIGDLPSEGTSYLTEPLLGAVKSLKRMEVNLPVPSGKDSVSVIESHRPHSPYRSLNVHEPYPTIPPIQTWGIAVEMLWQVAMVLNSRTAAWDALTARMLILKSIAGLNSNTNTPAEWVRREVVSNM
ncbi:hypothetical protein BDN72DRAFT_178326, partial [Pluteus cervinus]